MQRWRDILIDFVVDLPSSNGFTNIIIVVNCFIKMRYIIPIESINAILVAECFVKYVFKLYGLPNLIISNCGSQFVLDF
jgi:phage gp36-like protein